MQKRDFPLWASVSPSVKWADMLLAFARSSLGTDVCGVLGIGNKWLMPSYYYYCQERGVPAPEKVRPGCHEKPQGESGLVGWAGQGASREPEQKAFSGERRQLRAGNGQLEPSAVGRTTEGAVLGRFPGPVGSQATGRWSPSWASGPGGSSLLSTHYVPGMEEGQLIRSSQPWDQGPKSSWRKAVSNHLGAPMGIQEPGQLEE